ncbi:hypothetical protein K439DRAFT_1610304 [Ramaria rubella]|nr:hypothetical protein K439DRAFT_1610304 [Ramaria rubella]
MATASTPNHRASLLSGLRTGGVRSASQPQVPHTAAPTGSFNTPRFASVSHPSNSFPEEDDEDTQLADMVNHNLNLSNFNARQGIPMTASVADGAVNKFQQQQQKQLILRQLAAQRAALNGGMSYAVNGDQAEMQAQMMQMEMLKYQAYHQAQQAQQYQAELIAQAQRQQQQPARGNLRRPSMEPMTAGPTVASFDHRANAVAQLRARAQQAEHRSALAAADDIGPVSVPMTAAINGKFASRMLNPQANSFVASRFGDVEDDQSVFVPATAAAPVPSTPSRTTVISGGTALGTPTTTSFNIPTPSKSDAATSWRRANTNTSVLRSASATPPLNTKVNRTSPPNEETSPTARVRPQPLRFNIAASSSLPAVFVDSNADEEASSGSSKAGSPTSTSTPSTPPSAHSSLSADAKKPYEGLGMGRPVVPTNGAIRHTSLPSRQPRGPPSGADELGPRNFAARLRRKAINGLGTLVTAREKRDLAIEIQAY